MSSNKLYLALLACGAITLGAAESAAKAPAPVAAKPAEKAEAKPVDIWASLPAVVAEIDGKLAALDGQQTEIDKGKSELTAQLKAAEDADHGEEKHARHGGQQHEQQGDRQHDDGGNDAFFQQAVVLPAESVQAGRAERKNCFRRLK